MRKYKRNQKFGFIYIGSFRYFVNYNKIKMKKSLWILLIGILSFQMRGQMYKTYYETYENYREKSINNRRFTQEQLQKVLDSHPSLERKVIGKSVEGRPISMIQLGNGPIKVLLWSQMHGNESTATMALMDLLNFFEAEDGLTAHKKALLSQLTIYMIPMLNPDGAAHFRRHNAMGVDLNRDALRLQMPESRILKQTRDALNPDWGFNLHDQNRYYSAGLMQDKTASISFLAPAYNYKKEINEKRGEAMQLIVKLNEVLQNYIPGKVGRYNDDFEPRAFGDNIQKWGTRTILVETGALGEDLEKQYLRRMNFVLLLSAFNDIAFGGYQEVPITAYEDIPFNESNSFMDLLVKEVKYRYNDQDFILDLGFRRGEVEADFPAFTFRSNLHDLGDLSIFFAYESLEPDGYELFNGEYYENSIKKPADLLKLNPVALLKAGITKVLVEFNIKPGRIPNFPLDLVSQREGEGNPIFVGKNPSFILSKGNQPDWAVVNGFLIDLQEEEEITKNWLKGLESINTKP